MYCYKGQTGTEDSVWLWKPNMVQMSYGWWKASEKKLNQEIDPPGNEIQVYWVRSSNLTIFPQWRPSTLLIICERFLISVLLILFLYRAFPVIHTPGYPIYAASCLVHTEVLSWLCILQHPAIHHHHQLEVSAALFSLQTHHQNAESNNISCTACYFIFKKLNSKFFYFNPSLVNGCVCHSFWFLKFYIFLVN